MTHVTDVVNGTFSRMRRRVRVESESDMPDPLVILPLLYITIYIVHSGLNYVREYSLSGVF